MKKLVSIVLVTIWVITVSVSAYLIFRSPKSDAKEESIILELWQLDMLEGGKGSRRNYLITAAEEFEKRYNVLLTVVSQTPESAEEMFKNGIYPDMISYSQGLRGILPLCENLSDYKRAYGGEYKNAVYALPWALGGYFLIKREGVEEPTEVFVSKCDYNLPLLAAFLEGITLRNLTEMPPEQSYYAFLNDKSSTLLGTQRDLYRLSNKDIPLEVTPLTQYTDILQYISVIRGDKKRVTLCKEFIKILHEKSQIDINLLGMACPFGNEKLVDNGPIALLFPIKYKMTTSAFCQVETILEINSVLKDQNLDSDKKMKYIKNTIIYLK